MGETRWRKSINGVFQGPVLGLIWFNIFITDLRIKSMWMEFAGDTKLESIVNTNRYQSIIQKWSALRTGVIPMELNSIVQLQGHSFGN